MSSTAVACSLVLRLHLQVFKARLYNDVVAIKLLRHGNNSPAALEDRRYAKRELATLKVLRHTNVVQVRLPTQVAAAQALVRPLTSELAVLGSVQLQRESGSDHAAL